MALRHDPIAKQCRDFDLSPAVLGYDKKTTNRHPGANTRRKFSEYGLQLKEKQKLKFIYGVQETQFAHYYELAEKQAGITGENIIKLLERRLDNVVFRMGMAKTRREARQLVRHAHFKVNGKKVNIPSLILKVGDVVTVKDSSRSSAKFKELAELLETRLFPSWIEVDKENLAATVKALPVREELDYEVNEQLIVELYSK
jgi:small subunit ribosomal protein S4